MTFIDRTTWLLQKEESGAGKFTCEKISKLTR
jgi:hypothetical protein